MTPPATPPLEAFSLYRFFHAGDDEVLALRGVSLRLEAGEIVAVMGPSGSGKSTLLACLAGLDEPDGGQVRVDGHVLTRRSEKRRAELRARHIGVLFQADNLIGHLDVEDNLRTAQRLARADDEARRTELLDRLGIVGRRHALPAQMSGGEAVRAGLALALVNDPVVLIADEPTGEVDSATEQRILELLTAEAAGGRAVLLATHSPAVAAAAHRVVELVDGKVAV
ncbi:MAG TPA: ABC transporter ATP-binding protein [Acidimicrobiales bacterium]|jgi:putative ABC transport system ATP-binding protein|nr:ABC transporter ATP-binding protein [Acidimicrobiales bacterium]